MKKLLSVERKREVSPLFAEMTCAACEVFIGDEDAIKDNFVLEIFGLIVINFVVEVVDIINETGVVEENCTVVVERKVVVVEIV